MNVQNTKTTMDQTRRNKMGIKVEDDTAQHIN